MYRHKHNYIPCSTFTITKVQLHVSTINVGHLQVVHEELINKLYQLTQQCILEKLYYLWTKSKVLLYYIHSFTYLGPTLMAETCSCTLVIVNVLQGI